MRSLDRRRYRQRRVRDGRRTVPIFGIREDNNVWYSCHWCGWTLSVERDPDAFNDMGAIKGNYSVVTTVVPTPYNSDSLLFSTTDDTDIVLAEVDAAGDDKPPYINLTVQPVGCPLCGTRSNRT